MLLEDYRNERLRKLNEIKELGINPYPADSHRDTKISDILDNFDDFAKKPVVVAGRITAIRKFGKIAFVKIRDYSGEIQIFMQQEDAKDGLFNTKKLNLIGIFFFRK